MTQNPRILASGLQDKIMSAAQAAALIGPGMTVGMSGFTGAGYPKSVPSALAARIEAEHAQGRPFKVSIWTGASTSPELDGAMAKVDGIEMRLPYQSDPTCREYINAGRLEYMDIHLSHVAQHAWFGFLGKLDVALIEVTAINPDGSLVPSSSVGNNKTWLDLADKVIIEVNSGMDARLAGMHDVYYGTALPPHRKPVPILETRDRIGQPFLNCDPSKIIAIVETNEPDRGISFSAPDATSEAIAGHILEFLGHEVKKGRLPPSLLPIQSGVGNVSNAVMAGLDAGPFEGLTAFTEVIQDGMLQLLRSGKMVHASATALSLSREGQEILLNDLDYFRERILLRTQEISNHPEVVRRLGIIAINGMIEADIYGNVNSTHIRGSSIMNGIGGSGDFARNGYLSFFVTPSITRDGTSRIVPMATHVDHTEHDVQVLVTERGLSDLRGLSPKQRSAVIIDNCAHPDIQPALRAYVELAMRNPHGRHTPHVLDKAFTFLDEWKAAQAAKAA